MRFLKESPEKPELLAPAGTKEAFFAAINAGADAIYLSPKILNARAYGKNFTISEIADLVETAHYRGKKVFIALNSLMKESEISECINLLSALEAIGPDALIVQDMGVAYLAKRYFPRLRLHASTLMTIHNSLGVKVAEKLGFSRVVLARELTLREIALISRKSRIELEIFIHGAMCFTISGLCLFSSYFGGKSSTRGRCVQPCRRQYLLENKKGAFFSMNDLCALELIPQIKRIGIASLKIEGRLKPPHYIETVVRAYRRVLDSPEDDIEDAICTSQEELKYALGRPESKGFFLSPNPKDIISPTRAANTGLLLGKVINSDKDSIIISSKMALKAGDRLRFVIKKKDCQYAFKVKDVKELDQGLKIRGIFSQKKPESLKDALVFLSDIGIRDKKEKGENRIRVFKGQERLKASFLKAKKIINNIDEIQYGISSQKPLKARDVEIFIATKEIEREIFLNNRQHKIIVDLTKKNLKLSLGLKGVKNLDKRLIWALPPVIFEDEIDDFRSLIKGAVRAGFFEFQISNISHLSLFPEKAKLYSSYQINCLNSLSLLAYKKLGIKGVHFSIETDLKNLKEALSHSSVKPLLTVYGFIPIFTSRVSHKGFNPKRPIKSLRGETFYWRREGSIGRLYPSVPISFLTHFERLIEAGATRWIIDFRFSPKKRKKNLKVPESPKSLSRILRGRTFNLLSTLE